MGSIDNLKNLINHKISDGRKKMTVVVNDKNETSTNVIILFYNNEVDFVSTSKAPYYEIGIQVACRHNDYDKARLLAYNALEYINVRRKTLNGVYYIPETVPEYAGEDEQTGGYYWVFNVFMKGAK